MPVIQLALSLIVLGIIYRRMTGREIPSPPGKRQVILPVILGVISLIPSLAVTLGLMWFLKVGLGISTEGLPVFLRSFISAFVSAGFPEELSKMLMMLLCFRVFRKSIRNVYEYILVFSQKGSLNYYHDCEEYYGKDYKKNKFFYAVTNQGGKRVELDIKEVIKSLKNGIILNDVTFSNEGSSYTGTGYVIHATMKQVHDNIDDYEIGEDYIKKKNIKHLTKGSRLLLTIKNTDIVKQKLHPTQKSLELMKKLVSLYSKEGDTVLDFCMGSGSTGAACKELKRDFIGIEVDPHFFEIAKKPNFPYSFWSSSLSLITQFILSPSSFKVLFF